MLLDGGAPGMFKVNSVSDSMETLVGVVMGQPRLLVLRVSWAQMRIVLKQIILLS